MPIRKLAAGEQAYDAATYVGTDGTIFYNEDTGEFRLSDGVTPGGNPLPGTIATPSSPGAVQPGQGLEVDGLGILSVKDGAGITFDVENNLTVAVATADTLGGIRLGPGVTLNANDQLIIDSEGLDFSFGDFSATSEPGVDSTTSAVLSSINTDEPIVIRTNGTASVSVIGEFNVFSNDGDIGDRDPEFTVNGDGDVTATTLDITNSEDLGLMAPLNVSINSAGLTKTPAVVTGSVAQFTGRDDRTALLVIDTYGVDTDRSITGGELVFRTGRGTNASTTAVQADDRLGDVTAAGWASNGFGGLGVGGLRIVANENFTSTARGSRLELYVVPDGTIATSNIATIDETGVTMADDTGFANVGHIRFDTSHSESEPEGTICWDSADGTLNITHADGVVQQVGQELYAFAKNATGSTIADGTCVRFAGAEMPDGEARLLIAPFEADGTFPSLYGLGIATQTLSDDEEGRVCVWGKVRGIDTTGQGGETWIVGDILYASPTTAGGLTKVKPTAPNNVFPVAAVLAVDATDGELFVRPTVEQKMSYGVFTRTTDLSVSNNTPTVVGFDTAEISNGVSIVSNSRATVDQSGLYQIEWTLHWDSQGTGFGTDPVYTFLRKNGSDVANTLRRNSVADFDPAGQTFTNVRTLSLDADDYIEVVIVTTGGNVDLEYVAAITSPFNAPATAAAELTVAQIQL